MDILKIKQLREETGSGIIETKKALELYEGDYNQAKTYLLSNLIKEKGNSRVASKGLTGLVVLKDEAILYEVNAETDFVQKNEHFTLMMKDIGEMLIKSSATHVKDALKIEMPDGKTILDKINYTAALIKENAYLRRFYRIKKQTNQAFGYYQHLNGKISTLVILNKDLGPLNHKIAMHIAASEPTYLSLKHIDSNTMDYEKYIYEKNHDIFDEKAFHIHLENNTLYTQHYVLDPTMTIEDLLNQQDANIIDFFRFEVGQGIDNKLNCRLDIPCDGSTITVTPIM